MSRLPFAWCIGIAQLLIVASAIVLSIDVAMFVIGIGGGLYHIAMVFFAFLLLIIGVNDMVGFVRERDDFIAATSHDLRTPIAALQFLIGEDDDEALCAVERMRRMMANLDDFRRGVRRPEKIKFDLVEAFREAYALFSRDYECGEFGEIEVENDDSPVEVVADPTLVVQILWNLIGNDLKYAAPYGKVRARFFKGCVQLIDEGPGMSWFERRRAFDRYYRSRSVMKSGKGGFGIGLCTAREAARKMGGDLVLSPNRPHGCVFSLTLPHA